MARTERSKSLKRLKAEADKLWAACVRTRSAVCEICGGSPPLQAHHVFPRRKWAFLRYELANGLAVCGRCHVTLRWDQMYAVHGFLRAQGLVAAATLIGSWTRRRIEGRKGKAMNKKAILAVIGKLTEHLHAPAGEEVAHGK